MLSCSNHVSVQTAEIHVHGTQLIVTYNFNHSNPEARQQKI